ncbi:uncharacterized protein LOC116265722 isoform X1 [Nymphaea colorata]|nr:uncharacterized protein LOC116265722 isoform X1 [Nymphaea colorata]
MDGLMACCIGRCLVSPSARTRIFPHKVSFQTKCSRSDREFLFDDQNFDHWDRMELKFGRLLGEDPKLTLAKILGRKSNPDTSYLDIEKTFQRNKGKQEKDIDDALLLDLEKGPSTSPIQPSQHGPHRNKKLERNVNLVRPVVRKVTKAGFPVRSPVVKEQETKLHQMNCDDDQIMSTAIRRPSKPKATEIDSNENAKLQIRPNIFLQMRKDSKVESSNTLLRKPEQMSLILDSSPGEKNSSHSSVTDYKGESMKQSDGATEVHIFDPDETVHVGAGQNDLDKRKEDVGTHHDSIANMVPPSVSSLKEYLKSESLQQGALEMEGETWTEMQSSQPRSDKSLYVETISGGVRPVASDHPAEAALLGKPERLISVKKQTPLRNQTGGMGSNEGQNDTIAHESFATTAVEEYEENDWKRAEMLLSSGEREEVELISYSSRGFMVSFGSLIGFLPYRKLSGRWKFLAFESWLRRKGLDPLHYKQEMETEGNASLDKNLNKQPLGIEIDEKLAPNVELNNLLDAYDQDKSKYLSSFIGQKIKVNVIQADRHSRRLIFSGKPKESEEQSEKKKFLMAKLNIGDIVKCCITKITYFGIFVEVEGVPALIHHSEVSWDETLDPSSCFNVGQILEAKVHHLDFALERISLSLKQVVPDPLLESLKSVMDASGSSSENLEVTQSDVQWSAVDKLIDELKKINGIENVTKGRFFLSPSLAPTFQVYMASMVDNQYKLLARSENRVQEVLVQASLDKGEMKSAILTCTGRVV